MYGYLAIAVVFLVAIAGAGVKGYQLGGNNVRVDWDRANVEAAKSVEADRKAQEDKARKAASKLQARLETQKLASQQITDALNRELAKNPLPADCVVSDSLRQSINDALSGKGPTAGVLPATGKPAADAGGQPNRTGN